MGGPSLSTLSHNLIRQVLNGQTVLAPDVEYFTSVRNLCDFIESVTNLPFTSLNSGYANVSDFTQVNFKGGSEAGVINATTQVTTKDGKTYCLSATWNNTDPLDASRFAALYRTVLDTLQ